MADWITLGNRAINLDNARTICFNTDDAIAFVWFGGAQGDPAVCESFDDPEMTLALAGHINKVSSSFSIDRAFDLIEAKVASESLNDPDDEEDDEDEPEDEDQE